MLCSRSEQIFCSRSAFPTSAATAVAADNSNLVGTGGQGGGGGGGGSLLEDTWSQFADKCSLDIFRNHLQKHKQQAPSSRQNSTKGIHPATTGAATLSAAAVNTDNNGSIPRSKNGSLTPNGNIIPRTIFLVITAETYRFAPPSQFHATLCSITV